MFAKSFYSGMFAGYAALERLALEAKLQHILTQNPKTILRSTGESNEPSE